MSPSPSFNSFSNSNLAEIAARVVVEEFRVEDGVFAGINFDECYFQKREPGANGSDISGSANKDAGQEDVGEFEFASVSRENSAVLSTVSADEIFHNGKILPFYPTVNSNGSPMNSGTKNGLPLRKLLAEERHIFTATSSSSSSDVDELDRVPAETYCMRRPKAAEEERWKRSSFPSSLSKKWKFKDFLQRSFSFGSKDSLVLLSPGNGRRSKEEEETFKESPVARRNSHKEGLVFLSPSNGGRKNVSNNVKGQPAAAGKSKPPPYNRDSGEKRLSYLSYRQHQVGLFAYMYGLRKNLHPF